MMKTKRMLDLIMVGILPILMAYELVGEATHEVLGATMVLLVMVHHLLNRSWHTHLTRGPYTPLRIAYTVMDVVLLGLLAAQGISGVMMAKHTFGFLPHVGRRSAARVVHLMGAYWGFVLMGLRRASGSFPRWNGEAHASPWPPHCFTAELPLSGAGFRCICCA